jgi:hypothetical protein
LVAQDFYLGVEMPGVEESFCFPEGFVGFAELYLDVLREF